MIVQSQTLAVSALALDPDQVLLLADHAARCGRGFERAGAMPLVEPEADQRPALTVLAPDRAADLGHAHSLGLLFLLGRHACYSLASPSRRPMRSLTFLLRRWATARGEVTTERAAKVALIMLCGLEVPIDFATTSDTPSASKMARIGPPAMMPVPGAAVRSTTWPAP